MRTALPWILTLVLLLSMTACQGERAAQSGQKPQAATPDTSGPAAEEALPESLAVGPEESPHRRLDEIFVYPFSAGELASARDAAEDYVNQMEENGDAPSAFVECFAYDPMLTDLQVRRKLQSERIPAREEWDCYARHISFALVYSAGETTERTVVGVHLYRDSPDASWQVLGHDTEAAAFSSAILDPARLTELAADGERIMAGYRLNDGEALIFLLGRGAGAVTLRTAAYAAPPVQATPPDGAEEPLPEQAASTIWLESVPQRGAPIAPQPGDTAALWDPARAAAYPADTDCSAIELLEKWMYVEGLSYFDLDVRDCNQLILVVAREEDAVRTHTLCYERQPGGSWRPVDGLLWMDGYTGSAGVRHNRKLRSGASPAGLWGLGTAFGLAKAPAGIKMPWRAITPNSDWVCDVDSVYYNTWQERGDPSLVERWDYDAVEHLEDYTKTYTYACVIQYNTPPYTVPERGCAIFLHCSDHATEGCIGLLEPDMVDTLLWLDPTENPHILITGHQKK